MRTLSLLRHLTRLSVLVLATTAPSAQQTVEVLGPSGASLFGSEIASDGRVAALARPGEVVVLNRLATSWTFAQSIVSPNSSTNDQFGGSVAVISGAVAVAAPNTSNAIGSGVGGVMVFERQAGTWNLATQLSGSHAFGYFGHAIAGQGDWMAVASRSPELISVYRRDQTSGWIRVSQIAPTNALAGGLGTKMSLHGDVLVWGTVAQTVEVAHLIGGTWSHSQTLLPQPSDSRRFGGSVATDGSTIAVGDPRGSLTSCVGVCAHGCVHVWSRSALGWQPDGIVTPLVPMQSGDFGISVAVTRGAISAASRYHPTVGVSGGAVHLMTKRAGQWAVRREFLSPQALAFVDSWFGWALASADGQFLCCSLSAGPAGGHLWATDCVRAAQANLFGVPSGPGSVTIVPRSNPYLGATGELEVRIGTAQAVSAILIGRSRTSLPMLGGNLLAGPPYLGAVPVGSGVGASLASFPLPADSSLCAAGPLVFQAVGSDIQGSWSFSSGCEWTIGY